MRRLPENYVPCVFLGQGRAVNSSKCPAAGFDGPALPEAEPSSPEVNNNSCLEKECRQQTDRRQSKEVSSPPEGKEDPFLMSGFMAGFCAGAVPPDALHSDAALRSILEGLDF